MRDPGSESTAVKSTVTVGHKLDRNSLVTCCEARAVNRANEIWGLFFSASACASLNDSDVAGTGLFCPAVAGGTAIGMLEVAGGACCRVGAEGKLDGIPAPGTSCARLHAGTTKATQMSKAFFIQLFPMLGSVRLSPRACHKPADKLPAR